MQAHEHGPMLDLITAGKLQPGKLIGQRVSLAEAGDELKAMGGFYQAGTTVMDRFWSGLSRQGA